MNEQQLDPHTSLALFYRGIGSAGSIFGNTGHITDTPAVTS